MQTEVINLDALRAPSRKIQFLGREYEVGYIPSGASIPIIGAFNRLVKKQEQDVGTPDIEAHLAYSKEHKDTVADDTINFVADFCSFFYPDVTREEIANRASKTMVQAFFIAIIQAIQQDTAATASQSSSPDSSKKN